MTTKPWILPTIVIAQFCCTSLWFASNAVIDNLIHDFGITESSLGHLTSSVQFGFIIGTLLFAILTIADRFSPSRVFFVCSILGALCNLALILDSHTLWSIISLRFGTGLFLAGIYPVGMKIASDYFEKGLGKSLGFLVGALVLGTAFPHLLKAFFTSINWKLVITTTSILAVFGGLILVVFVKDGPYRSPLLQTRFLGAFNNFKNPKLKAAAIGYFGHMWELYAFWAFVPILLKTHEGIYQNLPLSISILSFIVIAVGFLSCIFAGISSEKFGVQLTAKTILGLSALCCLVSPLLFFIESSSILIIFLIIWGMLVIADSPLFSTLVAKHAERQLKASALTIVNCIGFTITIISIQVLSLLQLNYDSPFIYMILALGPLLGLYALRSAKT